MAAPGGKLDVKLVEPAPPRAPKCPKTTRAVLAVCVAALVVLAVNAQVPSGTVTLTKGPNAGESFTCTTTLSTGANVAAAVASAANGATICLNSGNYGTVNLWDIGRSGYVTIRSTSGVGAQMAPSVGNSDYIKFQSMTLSDMLVNSCSTNIQVVDSVFVANAGGLLFDASSCPSTTHSYLVDGVVFDDVGQANYEGRLSCRDCNGAIIRNSTFSGIGTEPSDGIQTQGNTQNLTIGPNNTFSDIIEDDCGAVHCDAIQLQGGGATLITSNYFVRGDTFIMAPDGSENVTVEQNVFDGNAQSYIDKIQFGSATSPTFRHNTLVKVRASFDSKTGEPATSNALVENNILITTSSFKTDGGNGCTSCTFRYTLFDNATYQSGTNVTIGTPSFVGGVSPSTYAGWKLASGSAGEDAGNDGKDLGVY